MGKICCENETKIYYEKFDEQLNKVLKFLSEPNSLEKSLKTLYKILWRFVISWLFSLQNLHDKTDRKLQASKSQSK